MTLNRDQLKFVDKFVHEQDVGKAAQSSGFTAKYGKKLYDMPEVRAAIDERLKIVKTEQAKQDQLHAMARNKAESRRRPHKV